MGSPGAWCYGNSALEAVLELIRRTAFMPLPAPVGGESLKALGR